MSAPVSLRDPRAFRIHAADNVATLLEGVAAGQTVEVLGPDRRTCLAADAIATGHKIALQPIAAGEAVLKFGCRIGHASQPIAAGAWVHLHNLASDLDERSGTLDVHSGAPTDTTSAYV